MGAVEEGGGATAGIIAAVGDFMFWGVTGAAAVVAGAPRSVGRFSRMVFGVVVSGGAIGMDVATPMAESKEMRDVFDFAAWTVAAT
jgi:hypothetical protein